MTTKKKVAKKAVSKKSSKEVTIKVDELQESNLSSAALAAFGNYDIAHFEGVKLDVTENKDLFSNDIIIPKIWLMQEMSELAKDKSRKDIESGDYVDSRSEEIILKVDDEEKGFIPLIVIKTFKRWQTFRMTEKGKPLERKVFISSELMTEKNAEMEYQFKEDGEDFTRRQVISAYVLKGEDAQKAVIKPYIVDFASGSKGGGRDMVSDIKALNARSLPSYVAWFKLGQKEQTSSNGDDFFAKTMNFGGPLPEQMMPFLKEAYVDITSMIDANIIEIDDRDVHEAAKSTDAKADVTTEAIATSAGI